MSGTFTLERRLREIISSIPGQAAVAVTCGSWEFSHQHHARLPAASIIKLLILLEAFRAQAAGRLDLDAPVPVRAADLVGGMGVLARLRSVAELSLRDLASLMIMVSDNTATNLVIDAVGMDRVNQLAGELGLAATSLQRRMMDFEARARGLDNYTSAADTVRILQAIWNGNLTGYQGRDAMLDILRHQQFNHKLPARFAQVTPGDPVLAHKTGELPGIEHNAGIIEKPGLPLFVAVLTTGLASNHAGQQAIAYMGEALFNWATATLE
ncbi:MAG: serine hydrolase [Bacillota bacterium]